MSLFSSQPEKIEPLTSRLTEVTHGSEAIAARAGKLLGSLPRPVPLSGAALNRIEDRLLSASSPVAISASPLRWVGLGATVAAAVTAAWLLGGRNSPARTSE